MTQQDYFGNGQWLTGTSELNQPFYILRSKFTLRSFTKARLTVLGLGFFHCYINGQRVSDDLFLPLFTDFEPRNNWPREEIVTGHRIYVPGYDVTDLLEEGENVIAVHFGGGWYAVNDERFGLPKAIWNLTVQTDDGDISFCSSGQDKISESYIPDYNFTTNAYDRHDFETQDLRKYEKDVFEKSYDDSAWANAIPAKPLDTRYLSTDCPADRLREDLSITKLSETDGISLYDTGKNCSALPYFRILAAEDETVTVDFYEALNADGTPDETTHHWQQFIIISDGQETETCPLFTWFAFRYFTITGNAVPVRVSMLCTDIEVSSAFKCDNEVLNWLYEAYITTQLSNMHTGIPSDCPHLERRGYTGDGQLTCHAAMNLLDAQTFYKKWIADISDCQDTLTGHVQYTAPYTRCGGGPGGWGCAIIEVPYQYYKHYGDKQFLIAMYDQMLRYFDYLEAKSVNALVVSDKEGAWCLGDWCPPEAVVLPAPFVNNYFYIKCLCRMIEIAKLIGHTEDIGLFEKRIGERKAAIMTAYFNKWDGNFLGNVQGANAFAVDIGIGDHRTYPELVKRYSKLEEYDTGIFGTDILTRVLFEKGDGELAAKLMASSKAHSFEGMRRTGATTLWEYWPEANYHRSLNHPMFGAVTAYLFDYILGIDQPKDSSNYDSLVIAPVVPSILQFAEGYRTLSCGKVSVKWEKEDTAVKFCITLPQGVTAQFRYGDVEKELQSTENVLYI